MHIFSIIGVFQSSLGYHWGSLGHHWGIIGVHRGINGVHWGKKTHRIEATLSSKNMCICFIWDNFLDPYPTFKKNKIYFIPIEVKKLIETGIEMSATFNTGCFELACIIFDENIALLCLHRHMNFKYRLEFYCFKNRSHADW